MAALTARPEVASVIASGPTKTSVRTVRGLQVDLRVVPLDAWGAALQYFTGSTAHNVAVRQIAVAPASSGCPNTGYSMPETGELIVSRTEEEVYARLGLAWVPPGDAGGPRGDRGGGQGQIPSLVRENDLSGDLHTHTDLTDGVASLEAMVAAAHAGGTSTTPSPTMRRT